MHNDRPIEDPNLQAGLDEIKAIMLRRGLAGTAMLVAPQEAAFVYGMSAPWSALRPDPTTPLGFRFRAIERETGKEETRRRVEGAMHTICQLCDFGYMTASYMDDLKGMLRDAGIAFEHVPYGGKPLQHLAPGEGAPSRARFECPRCGAVSFHPRDIAERYCGRCHVFVDDP